MARDIAAYLKKMGKKPHLVHAQVAQVDRFKTFLDSQSVFVLTAARTDPLEAYVEQYEKTEPGSTRMLMRGLILPHS